MAEYIAYIHPEQMRLGTERSVTATLAACGFTRVMRRCSGTMVPLATWLFVGESSYDERQLAHHLEVKLRFDAMCAMHVLVFRSDKLRARRAGDPLRLTVPLASGYLN